MVAITTSSARAAMICFSIAKCSLSSWLYYMHHGLGRRLFGGGVGDLGGRCRRRSGHVGCGRRRRMGTWCGLPAWIDEAEQREGGSPVRGAALQARSEDFNLKRKAETGEMWLLVRGKGRGGTYFYGSRKFGIASAKNWRTKCHQT